MISHQLFCLAVGLIMSSACTTWRRLISLKHPNSLAVLSFLTSHTIALTSHGRKGACRRLALVPKPLAVSSFCSVACTLQCSCAASGLRLPQCRLICPMAAYCPNYCMQLELSHWVACFKNKLRWSYMNALVYLMARQHLHATSTLMTRPLHTPNRHGAELAMGGPVTL